MERQTPSSAAADVAAAPAPRRDVGGGGAADDAQRDERGRRGGGHGDGEVLEVGGALQHPVAHEHRGVQRLKQRDRGERRRRRPRQRGVVREEPGTAGPAASRPTPTAVPAASAQDRLLSAARRAPGTSPAPRLAATSDCAATASASSAKSVTHQTCMQIWCAPAAPAPAASAVARTSTAWSKSVRAS